jgi:amino acid permease
MSCVRNLHTLRHLNLNLIFVAVFKKAYLKRNISQWRIVKYESYFSMWCIYKKIWGIETGKILGIKSRRKAHWVFVQKSQGKRPFLRPRFRWDTLLKWILKLLWAYCCGSIVVGLLLWAYCCGPISFRGKTLIHEINQGGTRTYTSHRSATHVLLGCEIFTNDSIN